MIKLNTCAYVVVGLVLLVTALWSAPALAATCEGACKCISICFQECDYGGILLTCGEYGVCRGMCLASAAPPGGSARSELDLLLSGPAAGSSAASASHGAPAAGCRPELAAEAVVTR